MTDTRDPQHDELRERLASAMFERRDDEYDTARWIDLTSADKELWLCYADAALSVLDVQSEQPPIAQPIYRPGVTLNKTLAQLLDPDGAGIDDTQWRQTMAELDRSTAEAWRHWAGRNLERLKQSQPFVAGALSVGVQPTETAEPDWATVVELETMARDERVRQAIADAIRMEADETDTKNDIVWFHSGLDVEGLVEAVVAALTDLGELASHRSLGVQTPDGANR